MAVAKCSDKISEPKNRHSWENCPVDILLIIFDYLHPKDLMNCILVNSCWRDTVTYFGQRRGIWQQLAEVSMINRGVSFRRRSLLPWCQLYINWRLWTHVRKATVKWKYELTTPNIKYINVYRDILIMETGERLLKKYYKIGDKLLDVTENLLNNERLCERNCGEGDTSSEQNGNCGDRVIQKLVKEGPLRRFLVPYEDCYYVLNDKGILGYSKWDDRNKRWLDYTLARYYGCESSISDINVYNGEVYMLLKTGLVFKLDRAGRNFVPSHRLEIPTTRLLAFSRLLGSNLLRSIEQVSNLNLPSYSTGKNVMLEKSCAVISVPNDRKFKMNVNNASGNVVLEYPDLTCAVQHGEVLVLGFKSGKIDIIIPKKLFETEDPEISVNIKDCSEYKGENPEIVALDVYEDEECHHLFVATNSSLYRLVLTYRDCVKEPVTGSM